MNILDPKVQHRELKLAESYQPTHNGLLPADPFWHYVEHRFDLAVNSGHLARFEHYHPVITPLLEENLRALTPAPPTVPLGTIPMLPTLPLVPVTPPSPECLPVIPVTPPTLPGPPLTGTTPPVAPSVPNAVPEPSSAVLGGLGLAVALLVGWLRR